MNRIGLVFDVDGVLLDTSASFPVVVSGVVQLCARKILGIHVPFLIFGMDHYSRAKKHPMFNDDYDIAWTFISWLASDPGLIGHSSRPAPDDWGAIIANCNCNPGVWTPQTFGDRIDRWYIRKICEEIYLGEEHFLKVRKTTPGIRVSGLWKRERPCLHTGWEKLGHPVGIYTGRNREEMELALSLLGWNDFPRNYCVTSDDGILKPSPDGLFLLEKKLEVSGVFFFGDSESDRVTFENYGKGRFFPVGSILSSMEGSFATVGEAIESLKSASL